MSTTLGFGIQKLTVAGCNLRSTTPRAVRQLHLGGCRSGSLVVARLLARRSCAHPLPSPPASARSNSPNSSEWWRFPARKTSPTSEAWRCEALRTTRPHCMPLLDASSLPPQTWRCRKAPPFFRHISQHQRIAQQPHLSSDLRQTRTSIRVRGLRPDGAHSCRCHCQLRCAFPCSDDVRRLGD
jgi:hypothetical protein